MATVGLGTAANAKVFISYARKDLAFVDRLDAALKVRGIDTLIDRSDIYALEDFWERIKALIGKADTMVFVLSPDALRPDSICHQEVAYALSLNKRFAPVVCRRVEDAIVPETLRRLNWIFFDDETRFEVSADKLGEALSTDIDWVRKHTEFGEQARRWAAAGRPGPRGLLLRSPVLEDAESWIASRPEGAPVPTEETQAFVAESRKAATRWRNILTGTMAAGLVVAAGLTALALWQRNAAIEQRGMAAAQRTIAEQQRAVAFEQRDRALLTQSRFLADLSKQRVRDFDAGTSVLLALEALPDKAIGISRPYAFEAEVALFEGQHELLEFKVLAGHRGAVTSAAFSADGRRVITASADRTARLFDPDSGETIFVLEGHQGQVNDAKFSPNGLLVVTASADKMARVWDTATGKTIAVLEGHADAVASAIFSNDGRRILTASRDRTARIWDAQTGQVIHDLRGHQGRLYGAIFSPDGRKVLTASADYSARLWDAETGDRLKVFAHDPSKGAKIRGNGGMPDGLVVVTGDVGVRAASFSPDGKHVVTAATDFTARVWDTESDQHLVELSGHESIVHNAVFNADGRFIVTASQDKTARLWDAKTGKVLEVAKEHDGEVWSAVFSPGGRQVLTASGDGTAVLLDFQIDAVATFAGHFAGVQNAVFNLDGTRVLTSSSDGTARIWDTGATRAVRNRPVRHGQSVVGPRLYPVLSPDGRRVLTSPDNVLVPSGETAHLWDAATGLLIASLSGHKGGIRRAAFNDNGSHVLIVGFDGVVHVWDAETGQPVIRFNSGPVDRVEVSTDGRRAMTTGWSEDHKAILWDVDRGEAIVALTSHGKPIRNFRFAPGGRYAVTVSEDALQIWDLGSGQLVHEFMDSSPPLRNFHFTGDGQRLLFSFLNNAARVWDINASKPIAFLSTENDVLVGFSSDGQSVLSRSQDSVRLWAADTGEFLRVFKGHRTTVTLAMLSPDGRYVLTASRDGVALLWSVDSEKPLFELKGHTRQIGTARFSLDSDRLVTSSGGSVNLWNVRSGELIAVLTKQNEPAGDAIFSHDGSRLTTASPYTVRFWQISPNTQSLVDRNKTATPRCLTGAQRVQAFLDAEPPAWCIEMSKWPYHTADWKAWLKHKRANANPPLPDTPEWKTWLAARAN